MFELFKKEEPCLCRYNFSSNAFYSITGCRHACYEQFVVEMDSCFRKKQVSCASIQRDVSWISYWFSCFTCNDPEVRVAIYLLFFWIPRDYLVCTLVEQSKATLLFATNL